MTAAELIQELRRRVTEVAIGNMYAMAVVYCELSKPSRYRDELKYESFESLVQDRDLGSHFTALKWIAVQNTFTEREVIWMRGFEKGYQLIRWARAQSPEMKPRDLLKPGVLVLGKAVPEVSAREIERALSEREEGPAAPAAGVKETTQRARRFRTWLAKLGIRASTRAHLDVPRPYVTAKFPSESVERLAEILKAAKDAGLV
jgi:hypothetical protein